MSDLAEDAIFTGRITDGISCEAFVRAVRKHAFSAGKARDNEYMADYAMTCLMDDALHWAETLSADVQGDWSLLRPAILAAYGHINQQAGPSSVTVPSALIPVPAAAPPIQPMQMTSSAPAPISTTVAALARPITSAVPTSSQGSAPRTSIPATRRGRIRVVAGSVSYYIILVDEVPARCYATLDISKAATMEATDIDGGIELQFANRFWKSTSGLGMVWEPKIVETGSYATLLPVERRQSKLVKPKGIPSVIWKGEVSMVKWKRSVDGILVPVLGIDEGFPAILTKTRNQDLIYFYITNDLQACAARNPLSGVEGVKLIFEPL